MKIHSILLHQPTSRLIFYKSLCPYIAVIVIIIALFPACAEKKMTLKEARQITISVSGRQLTPPPRRSYDIIEILNQSSKTDPKLIARMKNIYRSSPPETTDGEALFDFYWKKTNAAVFLGYFRQALKDGRTAIQHAERVGLFHEPLVHLVARIEKHLGNLKNAIEISERVLKKNYQWVATYINLIEIYGLLGDLESAKKIYDKGKEWYEEWFGIYERGGGTRYLYDFIKHCDAVIDAFWLEFKGNYCWAEPFWRNAIRYAKKYNSSYWGKRNAKQFGSSIAVVPLVRLSLTINLLQQDRIIEAEIEARQALKEALELFGENSELAALAVSILGEIQMKQGRFAEAEKIISVGISLLEKRGISADSLIVSKARTFLGNVLMARYNYEEAMKQYDLVKENLFENQFFYNRNIARRPPIMLCLLKNGRITEAMKLISAAYDFNSKTYGENHYLTAEVLALRGIANAKQNNHLNALKDFSHAVPILIGSKGIEGNNYLKRSVLKNIIESYIEVLIKINGTRLEKQVDLDAMSEAFRLTDILGAQSVQNALRSSSARASASDQGLAMLIRREQDTFNRIKYFQEAFANNLAMPANQLIPGVKEDLINKISTLTKARAAILSEIATRFPKYSDLLNPSALTLSAAQQLLGPDEALIATYVSREKSYVWALPHTGSPSFAIVNLGEKEINHLVSVLRISLDRIGKTIGSIQKYDLKTAFEIYKALLEPVAPGWKNAKNLLIVPHGALGYLPFSALATKAVDLGPEKEPLFSNYRDVPWLVSTHTITMLPSVSSLSTLRNLPKGDLNRKPFTGFGNPYFTSAMAKEDIDNEKTKLAPKVKGITRGNAIFQRGIKRSTTEENGPNSAGIESLPPLPDTAEEVRGIALALKADPDKDVFLGKRASEEQVKSLDLTRVRILAFATHGLLPGELDGLVQPALALSSPQVTGGKDDGLLTMGEIMALNLNADWVVLSACNTAAGDGAGAEAVSGLGRSFFYAGTKALLVSNWAVETTSAKTLTTNLFRRQAEDPSLSRSEALNHTMIEMIHNLDCKDNEGRSVFSYAHPIFWAPFSVIGDGN